MDTNETQVPLKGVAKIFEAGLQLKTWDIHGMSHFVTTSWGMQYMWSICFTCSRGVKSANSRNTIKRGWEGLLNCMAEHCSPNWGWSVLRIRQESGVVQWLPQQSDGWHCQGMTCFPLWKHLGVLPTLTPDTFGILWTPTTSQFQRCFRVLPIPSPFQQSPTLLHTPSTLTPCPTLQRLLRDLHFLWR